MICFHLFFCLCVCTFVRSGQNPASSTDFYGQVILIEIGLLKTHKRGLRYRFKIFEICYLLRVFTHDITKTNTGTPEWLHGKSKWWLILIMMMKILWNILVILEMYSMLAAWMYYPVQLTHSSAGNSSQFMQEESVPIERWWAAGVFEGNVGLCPTHSAIFVTILSTICLGLCYAMAL